MSARGAVGGRVAGDAHVGHLADPDAGDADVLARRSTPGGVAEDGRVGRLGPNWMLAIVAARMPVAKSVTAAKMMSLTS